MSGDPDNGELPFGGAIKAELLPVEALFRKAHQLKLPWLQRAYAWHEDHAERLLDDILDAYRRRRPYYRLGSISLAHKHGAPVAFVIDGQQRLVTMTLIFAIIRDLIGDVPERERLQACILRSAGGAGAAAVPALELQEDVQRYFRLAVQNAGAVSEGVDPFEGDPSDEISEAEQNIRDNLALLLRRFKRARVDLVGLALFALERCAIIVQTVEREDEAWRMLTTDEETGLDFHASDRAKVTLISKMRRREQHAAGRIWSHWQHNLGTAGIANLLHHLRVISLGGNMRSRNQTPLEHDLISSYRLETNGLAFMRGDFSAYAEALLELTEQEFDADAALDDPCDVALRRLSWVNFENWRAAALVWLVQNGKSHPASARFFARLARFTWLMMIATYDPANRDRLFGGVITDIKAGRDPDEMTSLEIPEKILAEAHVNLKSRTFFNKKSSSQVVQLICDLLGKPVTLRDKKGVTFEHVMPRRPEPGSQWIADFGEKGAYHYAERLGNIVLLTFEDNQKAGNKSWEVKRPVLAQSGFSVSEAAAEEPVWLPDTVIRRGDELVALLAEHWGLTGIWGAEGD